MAFSRIHRWSWSGEFRIFSSIKICRCGSSMIIVVWRWAATIREIRLSIICLRDNWNSSEIWNILDEMTIDHWSNILICHNERISRSIWKSWEIIEILRLLGLRLRLLRRFNIFFPFRILSRRLILILSCWNWIFLKTKISWFYWFIRILIEIG